jgi:hypothetical protein
MLRSSSLENYKKRKEEFFAMDHWRPQLCDYFECRVNNDIIQRAGRWHLEEVGIENAVNGITNNAAESMDNIYRNLRSKVKPKPSAELMVELKQVDDRIHMETTRAYYGQGTFSLTKDKAHLAKKPLEMPKIVQKECSRNTCGNGRNDRNGLVRYKRTKRMGRSNKGSTCRTIE